MKTLSTRPGTKEVLTNGVLSKSRLSGETSEASEKLPQLDWEHYFPRSERCRSSFNLLYFG